MIGLNALIDRIRSNDRAKNFGLVLYSNTVNNVSSFVITIGAARILGPSEFGRAGVGIAVAILFSLLADFGLSTTLIRQYNDHEDESERNRYLGIGLIGKGFVLLVMVAAYKPLEWLIVGAYPVLRGYSLLVFLSVLSGSLLSIWNSIRAIEQAKKRFRSYERYTLVYSSLRVLAVIVVLALGKVTIEGVLLSLYVIPLVAVVPFYCWFGNGRELVTVRPLFIRGWWHEIVRPALIYGRWVAISGIAFSVVSRLPLLSLSHRSSEAEVGIYSAALSFMAVFSLLNLSFRALLLPDVAALRSDSGIRKFVAKAGRLSPWYFATMLAVLFGILVLQYFVLGSEYYESLPILFVIGGAMIVTTYFSLLNTMVHALGMPHFEAQLNVVRVVVLGFFLWIVPPTSLSAALAYACVLTAGEVGMYLFLRTRRIGSSSVSSSP